MADCRHHHRRWFGGRLVCADCGRALAVVTFRADPDPMPRIRIPIVTPTRLFLASVACSLTAAATDPISGFGRSVAWTGIALFAAGLAAAAAEMFIYR